MSKKRQLKKQNYIKNFTDEIASTNEQPNNVDENVIIQYSGNEFITKEILAKVKKMWVNQGNDENSINIIDLYIKPEENTAYYVINKEFNGKVDL